MSASLQTTTAAPRSTARELSVAPTDARRWLIFAVTMFGLFMALLDMTVVNIAMPSLAHGLNTSIASVSWVLNAYNIVFAVLLVPMGRLADQFGRKRFYLLGMAIFTLGSLLCASSWSVGPLIGSRVIQGAGAAVLAPLALAITAAIFPDGKRGVALAMIGVVANVAAALGPPVGGLLLHYASWHWLFAINVPIGVVGIVLASRVMPETYDPTATARPDWWGMVTIGGSVFALTFALVVGNKLGWGSPTVVLAFASSVALGVAFAISQRRGRSRMVPPRLVRNREFIAACAAVFVFAIGYMGVPFLAVLGLIDVWKTSILAAALAVGPVALIAGGVAPIVGRLVGRVPARAIAAPSLLLIAGGLAWLGTFPEKPDYLHIAPGIVLVSIGLGGALPALSIGAMNALSGKDLGLASGIFTTARQLGFALSVALLVAVFTGVLHAREHTARAPAALVKREGAPLERAAARDAVSAGFLVAAGFVLLAAPISMAIRPARGEEPA
jgi:EmrB/QacA subfamily drug resistance transporter